MGQLLARSRASQQITLEFVAPSVLQCRHLAWRLDSFRVDANVERMRKRNNGMNDHAHFFVMAQVVREDAVNLDLVEGKTPQVGKARITGAKIVHRDGHTER